MSDFDPSTVLSGRAPAFALLYRPGTDAGHLDVLSLDARHIPALADVDLPDLSDQDGRGAARHDLLLLVPYRQLVERGLACHDDATPLVALSVRGQARINVAHALRELPHVELDLLGGDFDLDDDEYARTVRAVIADEIGRGAGSNFVIRRSLLARIVNHSVITALSIFGRLLQRERGAYWTFIVHDGQTTLVGATPERQVSLYDGIAAMTPISGTYRYPPVGATVEGLLRFLADGKETDELAMVVDEELKMMGAICPDGPRLFGPRLREMARLAHTEYTIEGRTDLEVTDLLRATMFAPTVTGSPLANACRVITRYERRGRGYYGGMLALVGREHGSRTLDAAIVIRTAQIDGAGQLEIGVGSTLVRHSDPAGEVAETRAKAAALESALGTTLGTTAGSGLLARTGAATATTAGLAADARVGPALAARNARLAKFWLGRCRPSPVPELAGRRMVILDAEDGFTSMLAQQLRTLGPRVVVLPYEGDWLAEEPDLVVVGPGPGDPRSLTDRRIVTLRSATVDLLTRRVPLLSVCLGHQVLASLLGLQLRRRTRPCQGAARDIDFDGERIRVGFYNTFVAHCEHDRIVAGLAGGPVTVHRDPVTCEVHGLSAPGLRSVQFHPESVLTEDGPTILGKLLRSALARPVAPVPARP